MANVELATPQTGVSRERGGSLGWTLFILCTVQLMVVLDTTVMIIALPKAQQGLHFSIADRQWVVTAYTLAFGGLLLLGGRIVDLLGPKRTIQVGATGFALASAVGGLSTNLTMLLIARAVQGIFAAVLSPSALTLLTTSFREPRKRAQAFAIFSSISIGGSAVGLLVSGLLTQYVSWRWCLYINLPIAGIAFLATVPVLSSEAIRRPARLDFAGAVLGSGGMIALVYGLGQAATDGWGSASVVGPFIGAAVLLGSFVGWQTRTNKPLLPLRVIGDRNRGTAFTTILLSGIAMFGVFFFLTYYMQLDRGYSPVLTGVAFLPMMGALILTSTQISARLLTRLPVRMIVAPGLLVAAGGMAILGQLQPGSTYAGTILPAELLLGIGLALTTMPSMVTATSGVARSDAGVTAAMANTSQQLGGSIGTALLNTLAASAITSYLAAHHGAVRAASIHGYAVGSRWATGILIAAAVFAGTLYSARPGRAHQPRQGGSDPQRETEKDKVAALAG